jgi:phenylpyruvate tautomerase PptA (4-oxalocrotonate tautomerase family)
VTSQGILFIEQVFDPSMITVIIEAAAETNWQLRRNESATPPKRTIAIVCA